jgi:hypothetical protein
MAMPRHVRAHREPAAPVVYEISGEIETVMHRLIRLNPVQFGWANNFKLGCVIVRGAKPKEHGGCVVLARFVKVAPLWHGLTAYDAIIRVEEWAWTRLSASQQEALVSHELCHGSMSEKGALRVMKHDLEEFGFVVRKYGAWQDEIALFDRQLAMFEPGFGTAPTEGEQKVVPFARPEKDLPERIVDAVLDHADEYFPGAVVDKERRSITVNTVEGCPMPGCNMPAEHPGDHVFPV